MKKQSSIIKRDQNNIMNIIDDIPSNLHNNDRGIWKLL